MSLLLPLDVWREVLEFVDPVQYSALARKESGVSREFYWLLKNSLSTLRIHHPVTPLCGVVWLESRDCSFSRIKRVEGERVRPFAPQVLSVPCPFYMHGTAGAFPPPLWHRGHIFCDPPLFFLFFDWSFDCCGSTRPIAELFVHHDPLESLPLRVS